ncbi:MAG: Ig-like domain-containing protein [Bacteriovoracaceae bacterium]
MVGFNKIWFTLFVLTFFAACVPKVKETTCGSGETFNSNLRACVAVSNDSNHAPSGVDQTVVVTEDTAVNFTVTQGSDQDGDTIAYSVVANPNYGTLSSCMNKSGSSGTSDLTCTYTPNSNYYGTDSFMYKLNDGTVDGSQYVTVTFSVTAVNDAPTVYAQYPTIVEDTATVYTFYYTDVENDLATACSVSGLVNLSAGACSCDVLGVCRVTLTPTANYNSTQAARTFSLNYTVTAGAVSSVGIEYPTVTAVNDTPSISASSSCTSPLAQDTALVCSTPTATDPDIVAGESQTLTWALASTNTCSWISMDSSTGAISGTPTDDNVGSCNLIYKVTDSASASVTDTTIALSVTNVAPSLATSVALTVPVEDSSSQTIGTISSVTGCAGAAFCLTGGDRLSNGTLTLLTSGTPCSDYGTISISGTSDPRNIVFQPTANVARQATSCDVTVQYDDGNGSTTSATATMTIQEVNDAPTLSPSTISAQTTNEATLFVVDSDTSTTAIDGFTLDEGGGSDEDTQNVTVTVSSSNTVMIPHTTTNIKLYSDSSLSSIYAGAVASSSGVTYNAPTGNGDSLYIALQPAAGQSGTATITVTLTDNGTTNGAAAAQTLTKTFTLTVTSTSAVHNDWYDIYAVGSKVLFDGTVSSGPSVRLDWNAFTVYNGTITGYNVYRSTSSTGPFLNPINATEITPASVMTYTDTSLASTDAPETSVSNFYYYKVMAVANGKALDTSNTYATIRVAIPRANMALIHRRIANKEACTTMGLTSDKLNYNRCAYTGPGDGYSGYFDLGKDYFVDRYEASCNYTINTSDCTETGGVGCIGNGTPTALAVTGSTDNVYYDRSGGQCYYYTSGSWKAISTLTVAEIAAFAEANQTTQETVTQVMKAPFPKRPPITYIKQQQASQYCSGGASFNPAYNTKNKSLISRQVHIAAAAWHKTTGASSFATSEQGNSTSLTTSQCNSDTTAPLYSQFQDGLLSTLFDLWSSTETDKADHSYVMAGSDVTASCSSRYGIQDLVGNLEEWNLDRFHNYNDETIIPVGAHLGAAPDESYASYMLDSNYNPYSYGSSVAGSESVASMLASGVNIDSSSSFQFVSGYDDLTKFWSTFGLPTATNTAYTLTLATQGYLNSDYFYFDSTLLNDGDYTVDTDELLGMTSGGSFTNAAGSGRWTARLRTVNHDSNNDGDYIDAGDVTLTTPTSEENKYTGFRCMIEAP